MYKDMMHGSQQEGGTLIEGRVQIDAGAEVGQRRGVLVLGMHRSGTSALAGLLGHLGCALPRDLIGPGVGNEKGHWEPEQIVALDDAILASGGSEWEDWASFNKAWYDSPLYGPKLVEARAALRQSFGDEPLFVLKDPRMCRLAPFWLAALKAEGIEPAIILTLRRPDQVAASLASRDAMEPGYAYLLWLRHMLEAEAATRGMRRVICSFEQILTDWPSVVDRIGTGTGIAWPRQSAMVRARIDEFLSGPGHDIGFNGAADPPPWLERAHAILNRWATNGEDRADDAELDAILREFDASCAVFGGIVLPGSRSRGAGGGDGLRRELLQQVEARTNQVQALEADVATLQAGIDAARRSQEDAEARASLAESIARQREEEVEQTRRERDEALQSVGQSHVEADVLRDKLVQADEWVLRLAADRRDAEQQAARMQRLSDDLQRRLEAALGARSRLDDTLSQAKRRIAELEADHASAGRLVEAQATLEQTEMRCAALEQRLGETEAALEQERRDAAARLAAADHSIAERFRETAVLTRLLAEAEKEGEVAAVQCAWLAQVHAYLARRPRWWSLIPKGWRRRREHAGLLQRGLFDAAAYLSLYPDVAAEGMDPVHHYVTHGMAEGRRLVR